MGDFFDGFTIDKLLSATTAYNQQRIDGRLDELKMQAAINGLPSRMSNPNASSDPATRVDGMSWMDRHGKALLVVAVVGLLGFVAFKALK